MALPLLEILVISLAFLVYYFHGKNKKDPRYPIGPRGLPIVGNLLQLQKPQEMLIKWTKEHGKIYSIRMGLEDCIVVSNHKLIKELFNEVEASGRHDNPIFLAVSEGRYGLVNTEGDAWESQRRFALRKLRDFGFAKSAMEGMMLEEINKLMSKLESKKGSPVSSHRLFNAAVVNSLWFIVTGERNEGEESELLKTAEIFMPAIQRVTETGLIFLPSLRHIIPELSGWNRLKKAVRATNSLCEKAIENHRAKLDPDNPKDFIDEYLIHMNNTTDENSSFYGNAGEKNLVANLADLFEGGNETTSTALSWIILYLSQHQNVQKRLQMEIDSVIGSSRRPSLSDKQRLIYAHAVMQEVLRMAFLNPFGVPHRMLSDMVFHGYFFPKGTTILPNLYMCAHDPDIWGDPQNFKPERFLSDDETAIRRHEAFLPFSIGRRVCPGESLARDTMLIFMTSIFQSFNVLPDPAQPNPNFEPAVGVLQLPKPYTVIVEKRSETE